MTNKEKEKKQAMKEIENYTKDILKSIKKAQKLADKYGIVFQVDLNGTRGTYYGDGHPQPPNESDFPRTEEGLAQYDEAMEKFWDEHGDAHPWGDYGWVSSSFDC